MLKPMPAFPDRYTPALLDYLRHQQLDPAQLRTRAAISNLVDLFHTACARDDLQTALRILALPLAEDRPLHQWLLLWGDGALHFQLTNRIQYHTSPDPEFAGLTPLECAFLLQIQGERLLALLPDDPPPLGNPPLDLGPAIGLYSLSAYLYEQAKHIPHMLACLHVLVELSLLHDDPDRLAQGQEWAERGVVVAEAHQLLAEMARFLYQRGRILFHLDDDPAAFACVTRLLTLPRSVFPASQHSQVWNLLGLLYERSGGLLEAMICYLKALPPLCRPPGPAHIPDTMIPLQAAVDWDEWQALMREAYQRAVDPTWCPPVLPSTTASRPPGSDSPPHITHL
jgi:tetratricopeptide (TPR) repeat protein